MEVCEAMGLEEFTCPKCGSSLSRKVDPIKPLAPTEDHD